MGGRQQGGLSQGQTLGVPRQEGEIGGGGQVPGGAGTMDMPGGTGTGRVGIRGLGALGAAASGREE